MLQREVRDLAEVRSLTELPRLAQLLAARSTGLLNYAGLSRDLGMPQTTLKRYLALLEAAFLVVTVPAWFRNVGKRLVKSPKQVLVDAGLLAHLLGREGVERSFGAVLESFVLMEIVKQAASSDARPTMCHYGTSDGLEVDAVIEPRGGPVCAIEVKAAATLSKVEGDVNRRFDKVDHELNRINDRLDGMHKILIYAVLTLGSAMVAGWGTMIALILTRT